MNFIRITLTPNFALLLSSVSRGADRPPNVVLIFADDLGEKKNLATKHPEVVADLKGLLTEHARRIEADTRPAAFVEDARPILTKPGNLPKLRDYLGQPETKAANATPR